MRLDNHIRGQV